MINTIKMNTQMGKSTEGNTEVMGFFCPICGGNTCHSLWEHFCLSCDGSQAQRACCWGLETPEEYCLKDGARLMKMADSVFSKK